MVVVGNTIMVVYLVYLEQQRMYCTYTVHVHYQYSFKSHSISHHCTHTYVLHPPLNTHQVLNMLLGDQHPGPCISFLSSEQRFNTPPDLHVPQLSPLLLNNALEPLLGYGAVAVRLKHFLQLVEQSANTVCCCVYVYQHNKTPKHQNNDSRHPSSNNTHLTKHTAHHRV